MHLVRFANHYVEEDEMRFLVLWSAALPLDQLPYPALEKNLR
jgi:hypothetical protein